MKKELKLLWIGVAREQRKEISKKDYLTDKGIEVLSLSHIFLHFQDYLYYLD